MAIDFAAIAPEIALAVTALVLLAADLSLRGPAKQLVNPLALVGTLVAIGFTLALWGQERSTFGGTFVVDSVALTFKLLFLGTLVAILGVSWRFFAEGRYFQGEYYFLLVTAFIGMLLMPSSRDLLAPVRRARDRVGARRSSWSDCASVTSTRRRLRSSSSSSGSCPSR
jgi:NADH:ubiquinone oxidoreductase subunit 2 (subunit N)